MVPAVSVPYIGFIVKISFPLVYLALKFIIAIICNSYVLTYFVGPGYVRT